MWLRYQRQAETEDANLLSSLESLSPREISSEPMALLCAYHAGMIERALGEPFDLTFFGRAGTGKFEFSIAGADNKTNHQITVNSAQCETDGGFEGKSSFALFEAKNQTVSDFNIRQLYYPFRLWHRKLIKPVVPVFFTYSNEVFSFYIYRFKTVEIYNSLELVGCKHYRIVPTEIEVEDVRRILAQTKVQPEPRNVPFPQADSFERIIDLLGALSGAQEFLSQEKITMNYEFDVRQTQYYTSAGRYLGLMEGYGHAEEGKAYRLTATGAKITSKDARSRNLALVEIILSRRVFRDAMNACLRTGELPPVAFVMQWMQDAKIELNPTTADRRAQTVLGWIRWIASLTKDA